MNKLEKQMLSALKAALADITDTARAHCARFNRKTKKYEFDDKTWRLSEPGSFKVAQQIRRAIAAAGQRQEGGG